MPKCPACGGKTDGGWIVCPLCATKLDSSVSLDFLHVISSYALDRTRYLWERNEGGKNIFKNFRIVENMGKFAFKTVEPVRKQLGDFAHIILVTMRQFSFAYLNPNQIYALHTIGKLHGYYAAQAILEEANLQGLVENLNKTGLFWKVFENKIYQQKNEEGWKKTGAGILKLKSIDKKENKQVYEIKECPSSAVHAPNPVCFMITGSLCGEAEAIFGGIWDGKEIKCQSKGDDCNEFEIWLQEREETPSVGLLTKEELGNIVDELIKAMVNRSPLRFKELTDDFYIIVDQVMNYYLISLSPGHALMSKYAGRLCGERIAKKANLEGLDNALSYLEDIFLYLKAGILRSEKKPDRVIIKMQESVYAAGVNNIHQNLCIFLAGIIEGTLNHATQKKWDVSEMKCLASGFPECEFWCKEL